MIRIQDLEYGKSEFRVLGVLNLDRAHALRATTLQLHPRPDLGTRSQEMRFVVNSIRWAGTELASRSAVRSPCRRKADADVLAKRK